MVRDDRDAYVNVVWTEEGCTGWQKDCQWVADQIRHPDATIVKRFFINTINMGTKYKEGILGAPKGLVWGPGLQAIAWFA